MTLRIFLFVCEEGTVPLLPAIPVQPAQASMWITLLTVAAGTLGGAAVHRVVTIRREQRAALRLNDDVEDEIDAPGFRLTPRREA